VDRGFMLRKEQPGRIVAFRSAKAAASPRCFRGAKGDKGLSATETKKWFVPGWIDLVLTAVAASLVGIGALLLWASPALWACYLTALDVRAWPPWKCVGVMVIVVESLLVVRYWPSRKCPWPLERARGKE
jgi:hypothetical protein